LAKFIPEYFILFYFAKITGLPCPENKIIKAKSSKWKNPILDQS